MPIFCALVKCGPLISPAALIDVAAGSEGVRLEPVIETVPVGVDEDVKEVASEDVKDVDSEDGKLVDKVGNAIVLCVGVAAALCD